MTVASFGLISILTYTIVSPCTMCLFHSKSLASPTLTEKLFLSAALKSVILELPLVCLNNNNNNNDNNKNEPREG